jgi:hypothetical protein
MPATFAHPAAVRPLLRLGQPAAFIIGALTPVAAYFLPGDGFRHCHRPGAALWFGLPTGLIGWFAFQRYLRPVLLELAPDWLRDRCWQLRTPHFSGFTAFLVRHESYISLLRLPRYAALGLKSTLVAGLFGSIFWGARLRKRIKP